jgi:hypothetical protein
VDNKAQDRQIFFDSEVEKVELEVPTLELQQSRRKELKPQLPGVRTCVVALYHF